MTTPSRPDSTNRAPLRLLTLLALAAGCGGPEGEDAEPLGTLPQALTRSWTAFQGVAPEAYDKTDAEQDFGPLASWDPTNKITVGSASGNEYLRVTLPSATENVGGKFRPRLWTSGEYATATVRWRVYLESGWDFYNGDLKMAGVGGGKNYTGGDGAQTKSSCDGWSLRFVFSGNPNNKLYAYYYGCDMAGLYSNGQVYGDKLGTGCALTVGEWYTLILSTQANTSGQANGKLRMWVRRDSTGAVCTVWSTDTRRLANDTSLSSLHENYPSVWNAEVFRGGAGEPPAENHYLRIDDVLWNNYFYASAPSL